MLTWFTSFWFENSTEITIAIIAGTFLLIPTLIFNRMFATNPIRQRRTLRNKKARLTARLERHLANKENPVPALTFIVLAITFQLVSWFAAFALTAILVSVDIYVIGFLPNSSDPLTARGVLLTMLLIFGLPLIQFVPALVDLFHLRYPGILGRRLKKRIQELDEDTSV